MRPTFVQTPAHYTLPEFSATLGRYATSQWRPAFPTLHNTGVPSLAQWLAMGATPQERWGASLNRYYEGLGWHAGPHLVVCPDYVWILSDLAQPGVSVSCWNAKTIGIEMVGNYEVGGDEFASGLGAKVRDNAAHAIAFLTELFGWSDLSDCVVGERGLHFHRECARDHHSCPGSRVDKHDMLERIAAIRSSNNAAPLTDTATSPSVHPDARAATDCDDAIKTLQLELQALQLGGNLRVDGILGPDTRAAVVDFQRSHDLTEDWEPGSRTRALLAALTAHAS